jgi:hypothetical protein
MGGAPSPRTRLAHAPIGGDPARWRRARWLLQLLLNCSCILVASASASPPTPHIAEAELRAVLSRAATVQTSIGGCTGHPGVAWQNNTWASPAGWDEISWCAHQPAEVYRNGWLGYAAEKNDPAGHFEVACPGRKPAFLVFKRPARPYKSPIQQNRFT